MWRPSQEKQLRIEPSNIQGATGAEGSPKIPPVVPKVHLSDGSQCHQKDKTAQRKRRLGRSAGSPALLQHYPDWTVIRTGCSVLGMS